MRDSEHEGFRAGWFQDRRDSGQEGYMTGGIQDRRDAGHWTVRIHCQVRFRTGCMREGQDKCKQMQDRMDVEEDKCRTYF